MPWSILVRWAATTLCVALLPEVAGRGIHDLSGQQTPLGEGKDAELGAVASENRVCSQIGIDLLRSGGNAADAAVGTVLCVGVIGMYHSGIGGGGFILVRDSAGQYEFIDGRETAPAAASEDMFKDNITAALFGGLASGVPGDIRALEYLHDKYGRLSWRDVLSPAINVARDGFNVTKDIVRYMEVSTKDYDFLVEEPEWAVDFAPNGTRVGLGDILKRPRYADTLQTISDEGSDAFYDGPIADATVRAVRGHGGILTHKDLRSYKIQSRPVLDMEYRNFRLIGCGSPAGGAVGFSALKTVEGYEDIGDWSAINMSTHRMDEALRFAYGERGLLGDPTFVENATQYESNMLKASTAAAKRNKISDSHTLNLSDYNPQGYEIREDHGTSHVVTADNSGMAISLTTTLNLIFGSRVIVPETGVIMNDQMADFSIPGYKNAFGYYPSPSNFIRPGKRPMSSMMPVIAEHIGNGSLYYVVGAAGGSRIITATVQNLWHVLDHQMNVSAGLAMPRFHDQLLPNIVGFEWSSDNHTLPDQPGVPGDKSPPPPVIDPRHTGNVWMDNVPPAVFSSETQLHILNRSESGVGTGYISGYDNRTVAFMQDRGHNVTWVPPGFSSAQALRLMGNGTFEAAGDPRQADSGGFAI